MSTSRAQAHRSVDGHSPAMKLVVTGTDEWARIASRSATKHASRASFVKRAKSRRCAGLTTEAATAGTPTCSHSP